METKIQELKKLQAEINDLEKFRDDFIVNKWFSSPVPDQEQQKYDNSFGIIESNRRKISEIIMSC